MTSYAEKPFARLKIPADLLLALQIDFKRVFNDSISKKILANPISNIGFFIPFGLLNRDSYPILYQWFNESQIKQTMSKKEFRLLYTDPINLFNTKSPYQASCFFYLECI